MTEPEKSPLGIRVEYDPFAGDAIQQIVPTTDAQREIWLADQLGRDASLAYNESSSLVLEGRVDEQALCLAIQDVSDRHEALRSTIGPEGDELRIFAQVTVPITRIDLRGSPSGATEAVRSERLRAVQEPFNLGDGPLFRATLIHLGDTTLELILTAHHVVCDGWSLGVIAKDLLALYGSRVEGAASMLPPAESFAAYAIEQTGPALHEHQAADERYWVELFDGAAPILDLPCDGPRPRERTFASRRTDVVLDAELTNRVRQWGAGQGSSLFSTLFGVFAGLMARLSGSSDIVVGVPAAGQAIDDRLELVGHCVYLLPIRVAVDFDQPATALLKTAKTAVLDAYEHPHCTLGSLLTKLQIAREPGRVPLVSVLFNLDAPIPDLGVGDRGLAVAVEGNPRCFENFELFLNVSQRQGTLVLECQYNTMLFSAGTIDRWLELYRCALSRLVADGALGAAEAFAPIDGDVRRLSKFNDSAAEFDRTLRVDGMIARQVAKSPDAIAVVSGDRRLTYRELEARATSLAAALQQEGVCAGDLVGLFCDRTEQMLVGLYGILKAGAGYVPLDPSFPPARLAFMIEDAGLRLVVTDDKSRVESTLGDVRSIQVDVASASDRPLAMLGSAEDVAYVIYTSGSTGRPKGVCVPHRSLVNLLTSLRQVPGMGTGHVVLAVTTLSFDIAVSEVVMPLTVGATVVLANRAETSDGDLLGRLIEKESVSFIDATPATWRLLLDAGWRGRNGLLAICTGEPLPPELGRQLLPLVGELWNGYGPTETTVWSSFQRVTEITGAVPIGRPIANTQFHVLDASRRQLPVGVVGELYIGGEGVTLGYLNRPDLTADRFVPAAGPAPGAGRWYRTGDLGKWRADGTLECLGRVDHQVKVRGYRIELGEIEAAILAHPDVSRALVVTMEDTPGDVRIVAYVVPHTTMPEASDLRRALGTLLPEFMVPQHFVQLKAIPLLPNGKIDRKSLPHPSTMPTLRRTERVQPRTHVEATVVALMEEVLKLPGISVRDDFFDLGGHSLLVAKLTSRVNRQFAIALPLRTLFEARTAERMAVAVSAAQEAPPPTRKAVQHDPGRRSAPLTTMQERIRFVEELYPGRVVYNTPSAHRLKGPLQVDLFVEAFGEIVQRQPALRTYVARSHDGSGYVQHVLDTLEFPFPYEDLSALPEGEREQELLRRMQVVIDTAFDIHKAPLFRVALYKLGPEHHAFLFMPHHIIWDGWSFDLLYEEMAAAYGALTSAQPNRLAAPSVSYGDFAAWHHEWLDSPAFDRELAYWKTRLAKHADPRPLRTDKPRRPGVMSGEGASEWVRVDKATTEHLRILASDADVTLSTLTMSVFAAMLAELSDSPSVLLGMPVRGRQMVELENVMGFFNNLLPIHVSVNRDQTVAAFAKELKLDLLDAFSYQEVPFERLAADPAFAARAQRIGAYQALFSFQDARDRTRRWGELDQSSILVFQKGATEDLGLWLMEVPGGLEGGLVYNTELYSDQTARAFRDCYLSAVHRFSDDPSTPLSGLVDASTKDLLLAQSVDIDTRPVASVNAVSHTPASPEEESENEQALRRIWADLLDMDEEQISTQDNFFDMGGSSLLAMRAVELAGRTLGYRVDARRYFSESLSQLAATPTDSSNFGRSDRG